MSTTNSFDDDALREQLGAPHQPAKDPMKGLRGVMAGILVCESISLLLVLTVILQINEGEYWTPVNMWFVVIVGGAHFIAAFLQRLRFAIPLIIVLQILALGGFFVHWSMGVTAIVFVCVWGLVFYLRSIVLERMARGLLVTQYT